MTYDGNGFAKKYYEFNDFWLDITYPLYEDEQKQQDLFFCFQFRIFISILGSMRLEDIERLTSIASNFFHLSRNETVANVDDLKKLLPTFLLNEKSKLKVPTYLELLSDTHLKYDADSSHTFSEGIEYMPEALEYPPELTFTILSSLGYKKNNTI